MKSRESRLENNQAITFQGSVNYLIRCAVDELVITLCHIVNDAGYRLQALYREKDREQLVSVVRWGECFRSRTEDMYPSPATGLRFAGEVASAIAGMIPGIMVSCVDYQLGMLVTFCAASGGAIEKALTHGAMPKAAIRFGTIVGIAELATAQTAGCLQKLIRAVEGPVVCAASARERSSHVRWRENSLPCLLELVGDGLEEVMLEQIYAQIGRILLYTDKPRLAGLPAFYPVNRTGIVGKQNQLHIQRTVIYNTQDRQETGRLPRRSFPNAKACAITYSTRAPPTGRAESPPTAAVVKGAAFRTGPAAMPARRSWRRPPTYRNPAE